MSQAVIDALGHPLFVAIFSIAVSGILLAELSRRRDRRNEILKQRISFIDETVTLLNRATNNVFGDVAEGLEEPREQTLESIGVAFRHRLRFELYSQALFRGQVDTEKDFVDILHCLNGVAQEMRAGTTWRGRNHIDCRNQLVERWKIEELDMSWGRTLPDERKEYATSVGVCFRSSRELLSMMLEVTV